MTVTMAPGIQLMECWNLQPYIPPTRSASDVTDRVRTKHGYCACAGGPTVRLQTPECCTAQTAIMWHSKHIDDGGQDYPPHDSLHSRPDWAEQDGRKNPDQASKTPAWLTATKHGRLSYIGADVRGVCAATHNIHPRPSWTAWCPPSKKGGHQGKGREEKRVENKSEESIGKHNGAPISMD